MSRISALRAQHAAAEQLFDEIFDLIRSYRREGEAYRLSLRLAWLASVVRTQFAMEDELVYPRLLASNRRDAAMVAHLFKNELRPLLRQFEQFVRRWSSGDRIAASLGQFEFEAGMVFAALRDRIRREADQLLPLAEQIEVPHATAFRPPTAPGSWQLSAK